ncbi:DUF4142 domain-containing protein [Anaeromyxobacter oryzae]|uniref:DUF4142 domain-containing protein n=1 Tax=Anaeromyxobacter oryzae TaxID=2918170 RepID=A0ABM7WYI9_9BACT|nr:DUF4142 domain-containing protein [Anaeromyxobacter oryzae]BDG04589.1 hypothetical protein AMOR_35850 [Anaeromyxobacter oryzae]
MTKTSYRLLVAAGAAALTLGGTARAQSTPPGTPPPRTVPQPAPAPPTSTPPAPTPPSAQPGGTGSAGPNGQISADDLRGKLGPLHARNAGYRDAGKLAAERGNNPQVKSLGSKMQQDYQKLDDDLTKLAKERGFDIGNVGQADTAAKDAVLTRLRGESGDQFDTDFIHEMIQDLEADVASTKQMRESTPGKDARVKKWLDDAENVMEDHLNQARAAKVTIDKARGQAKR